MTLADELFGPPRGDDTPPEAQRVAWFLARGVRPVCTFMRRREGLGWTQARIVISYPDADPPTPPESAVPWDQRFERWLLSHGVKAIDLANEAERFGYHLGPQLESIERRCGSGYFNSVLDGYLRDSGFAQHPAVRQKLDALDRQYQPYAGEHLADIVEQIRDVLAGNARTLEALPYPRPEAIEILANAVAYYLDDRFNIHTRSLLGFG
jgi:hypothetical protein